MNVSIIIQARTGSTRLPKKMILPFYNGKLVLELLIEKLKANFSIPIILATTVNRSDDAIESIAKTQNILCFIGDESNVLKYNLLKNFNTFAQLIMRVLLVQIVQNN